MPVQQEHRAREENDLERVGERQVDAGEHQLLDGGDIAGEAGDEVAELTPFEPADRQSLQVREQPHPQRCHEPLADPGGEVFVDEAHQPADDGEARRRRARWGGTAGSRAGVRTSSTSTLKR